MTTIHNSPAPLRFTGHRHLTSRLVLATLTGRAVHITQIRAKSLTSPGLAPHEVSFLRLLDAVTNGSHIEFGYTGTSLLYRPGLISGSAPGFGADANGVIKHEITGQNGRGLSYFLLPLCLLAPFAKNQVNVLFTGAGVITAATKRDISVDTLRTAILPLFAPFGIHPDRIDIRTLQRSGTGPRGVGGAGQVHLVFAQQIRLPKTVHLLAAGRVKSVRGVAYAVGVGGANNARMIEAARGVLNRFVPDTRIFSENSAAGFVALGDGKSARKQKMGIGFGIALVAETAAGTRFSADVVAPPEGGVPPEDVGRNCALQLLEVIEKGGAAPATAAPTVLTLMAMGGEDVGRVVLGKDVLGSEDIVQLARDFRQFGFSAWGLRDHDDGDGVVVSIVGRGVGNVGRKIA
jgi:RNA 3'-terminal phosphate cyclase-like protein